MSHDDDTFPHLVVLGRLEAEKAHLKWLVIHYGIEAKDFEAKWLIVLEENARLKAEVESYEVASVHTCSRGCQKPGCPRKYLDEIADLKAEVDRLTAFTTRTIIPNEELQAQVERLTKAVMHSPAAQLKLKELEGKTTYKEINGKIPPCIDRYEAK